MKKPVNEETLQEIKKSFEMFKKEGNGNYKAAYLAMQKYGFNSYDKSVNGHIQVLNEDTREYVIFSESTIKLDQVFEKIQYTIHNNNNVFNVDEVFNDIEEKKYR